MRADGCRMVEPGRALSLVAVLRRLANIAMNVTEKQPTQTLHVFPEEAFVKYVGKVSGVMLLVRYAPSCDSTLPVMPRTPTST